MKNILYGTAYLFFSISLSGTPSRWAGIVNLDQIAQKIWLNECGGTKEGLIGWNAGEEFASLGIGHFIWYPNNSIQVFVQSFPALLDFIEQHGYTLPRWLIYAKHHGCPWSSREQLLKDTQSTHKIQLQTILENTIKLQALFILKRIEQFEKRLKQNSSYAHARKQLKRLLTTDQALYAVIDYLNFKGEGFEKQEAYQGHSWGLLQILERMKGTTGGTPALQEFCTIAKKILKRRTELAPPERNEARWLPGWYNRIDRYLT